MRTFVRSCLLAWFALSSLYAAVQWREGFELGAPGWTIEGATWEFGPPTAANGPAAFAGTGVAGTVLAGNYGPTHHARLITPSFVVPPAGEAPRVTFHSWYQLGAHDYGQVQARVGGGAWQDVAGTRLTESGNGWTRGSVDLRAFAGQSVQLAFHFVAAFDNRAGDLALGWYLDEAALETGPMTLAAPEGFENGFGDWSVEGGVWGVGPPRAARGPAAFAGAQVAGTTLGPGSYGSTHDARLITPEFIVPPASEAPRLTFHSWYQIGANDHGAVQVRVVGGAWQDVAGTRLTESGNGWARGSVDLRAFAGQRVQLAFHLVTAFDNRAGDLALGWYIDEAALKTGPMTLAAPEGFENGFGDWSAEGGVWGVGPPRAVRGPAAFAGTQVAGTTLSAGSYGTAHDTRLITPEFVVPAATQFPRFSFHYWYAFGFADYGQVQIRVVGRDWQDAPGGRLTEGGESWARHSVDLRGFAGQTVQLGFRLVTQFDNRRGDLDLGWFIDQAGLETGPIAPGSTQGFETGFGDWSVENGVWQVGKPTLPGAPAPFAGNAVAGTALTENYGTTHDARLLTPEYRVPAATQSPRFSYYYWYAIGGGDSAQLQIRLLGGAWQDVAGEKLTGTGGAWARRSVDLRAFAGQTVQLAFRLVTTFNNYRGDSAPGWFVDEARFETGPPAFSPPESFETGFGQWSVEGGVWQIGAPSGRGRPNPFAGAAVAGTFLAGTYPDNADARLVSPEFIVPPAQRAPQLSLHDWHALLNRDRGQVEVSVAGGDWVALGPAVTGSSSGWKRRVFDLTSFAGQPVRVAFHLISDRWGGSAGWYVDDVRLESIDPAQLALGQNTPGSLPATGARMLYQLDVPPGGHLRFTFDDQDDRGANQLFVRRAAIPTTGAYDHRSAAGTDLSLFVPNAGAGPWFVLVLGTSVPAGGSAYQIRADDSDGIALASLTPTRVGNVAPAVLDVRGAGFDASARIELRSGSTVVATGSATGSTSDRLQAHLPLANVPAGTYALTVVQGSHASSLPLEVIAGGLPRFDARLIAPGRVGRHAPATFLVEYSNLGDVAMPAPLLAVRGSKGALLTLDASLSGRGLWAASYPAGFAPVAQFLASGETAGVLQPGETRRVPVYYAGLVKPWNMADTSVRFELGMMDTNNADVIDWARFKDSARPHHVPADAWDVIWQNFSRATGRTWGDYVRMLAANATYLHSLGSHVIDVHALTRFEFAQADGFNLLLAPVEADDATLRQPGLDLTFQRLFPSSNSQRYRQGTLGRGWSHNWDYVLAPTPDGTRSLLEPGGWRRDFQPDVRGGFLSDTGDHAKLVALRDGTFELREPDGLKRVFRADGRQLHLEDANGNRITATYAGPQLVRLAHSAGAQLDFTYAGALLQSVSDSAGRTTSYRYDAAGHLVSVSAPDGATATYAYDAARHALTQATAADGRQVHFSYDALGRLASTHRGANADAATFTYDDAGTASVRDSAGAGAAFRFDHRGLLTVAEYPLGRRLTLTHDASYNLLSITAPDGTRTSFEYDKRGQPIRITDALGQRVALAYNPAGRLQRVTDPLRHTTGLERSPAGNLTAIVEPDSTRLKQTFDAYGGTATFTNRRGQTITFTRDAAGRLLRKTLPEGRTIDCRYDPHGNLIAIVDSVHGTTALGYDTRDRLISLEYPDRRGFTFAYDDAGRRTSRVGHDGYTLRYAYDDAGRLARLEDGTGRAIAAYTYDSTGRLARENKGNGSWTAYDHDAAGQLVRLVNHAPDGSVASRFESTYDQRGQRTTLNSLAGTTVFTYDATGQLLTVTHPDGRTAQYDYDAAGNRTRAVQAGVPVAYTTNAVNQYTQAGPARFTYDADGNLVRRVDAGGTTEFAYDSENQLVRLVSSIEGTWTFTYDAWGNRIASTHNGATRQFVPDPIGFVDVAAEYDGGTLVARYDHGLGLAQRVAADGTRAFYNFDPLGSTREMTDGGGAVVNAYDYEPYGEVLRRRETVPNPFTFVGRAGVRAGPAGLLHMRRRDYDPRVGRFTTQDPLGLEGDLNSYRYAFNAPNLYGDPKGELLMLLLPVMAGGAIFWGIWENGDIGYYRHLNPDNPAAMIDMERRRTSDQRMKQKEAAARFAQAAKDIAGLPTSLKGGWKSFWKFIGQNFDKFVNFLRWLDQQIAKVIDPNELIGPAGHGPGNHHRGDEPFAYRLNFENDRTATAPAQIVEISNPLPADLDLATFELTSAGFGDIVIPIPPGSQQFEHTEKVTMQDTTFDVVLEISLDPATRELRAKFSSVMPETGLPPAVEIGFLPPENDTGRGMGHISYLARPKSALPTGTEIRNIGFVTFDRLAGGPTYRTDLSDIHDPNSPPSPARQALVTIDADAPASRVAALPAETVATDFTVAWSGTDRGAGIVGHDLYVQTDGGPWQRWLAATTEKSASWKGQYGHRYGFFSVATDGAGFSETPPAAGAAPQAVTLTVRPWWLNPWVWTAAGVLVAALLGGLGLKSRRAR